MFPKLRRAPMTVAESQVGLSSCQMHRHGRCSRPFPRMALSIKSWIGEGYRRRR